MRWVNDQRLYSITGATLRVPVRNEVGDIVFEVQNVQKVVTKEATVSDLILELILGFPTQSLKIQDTVHGARLYSQILRSIAEAETEGLLTLEDAEWDWVIQKLEDPTLGPQMLGMNLVPVKGRLKDLEIEGAKIHIEEIEALKVAKKTVASEQLAAGGRVSNT